MTFSRTRLTWTGPYNVPWMQWFLSAHAVPLMETYSDGLYRRTLRLPHGHGSVALRFDADGVDLDVDAADARDIEAAVTAVRSVLTLDIDSTDVDAALAADPALAGSIADAPGIRVPGSFDGAELLLRTMIGQQISLAAAATHTARLVAALGEPVELAADPASPTLLFPTAAAIADSGGSILTGPSRRITAIIDTAAAIAAGDVDLHSERSAAELESELLALRGVGPWTARYVSMRLLGDTDVLLDTDLVVRQGAALLGLDIRGRGPDRWRPWRSYVSMHLWRVALQARERQPGGKTRSRTVK